MFLGLFHAVCVLLLCGGCSSPLIPGYEVLPLPAAADHYPAGAQWLPRIGTTGEPLAATKTSSGLNDDFISNTNKAMAGLEVPLIKYVSGSLGLGKEQVTSLGLTNLSHVTVSDSKDINAPVLWETVVVSNFTFRVVQSKDQHLSVDVPLTKLIPGSTGSVHVAVTNLPSGEHLAHADHPLVVAIRVVQPVQDKTSASAPLDLSDTGVDKQTRVLDYEVTLQKPVDPFKKEAAIRIENPDIPQFKGLLHTFKHSEPWVSPSRRVISGDDPKSRSVDFVWDKLDVHWNANLSKCTLEVTRQYTRFVPMKSGLAGTR
jgi:hypothetical protein